MLDYYTTRCGAAAPTMAMGRDTREKMEDSMSRNTRVQVIRSSHFSLFLAFLYITYHTDRIDGHGFMSTTGVPKRNSLDRERVERDMENDRGRGEREE